MTESVSPNPVDFNGSRTEGIELLVPPSNVIAASPLSPEVDAMVIETRTAVENVLSGKDSRLIVVVGPCSIHDRNGASDYAKRLKGVIDHHRDELVIIMRAYFEKPRTTVGWKGLLNDPHLNGTYDMNFGLNLGRSILKEINELGVPTGCEYLDSLIPQYTSDLISWAAIGARTTESQLHRELASGLSMPVGFKNATSGDTCVAVEACQTAVEPHVFLGTSKAGQICVVKSKGNPYSHVVLRGGKSGTNFHEEAVQATVAKLESAALPCSKVVIDCSHGNSQKDFRKQIEVVASVAERISSGNTNVAGLMIESNIHEGNQKLVLATKDAPQSSENLKYGVSVTDGCVGWEETKMLLATLAGAVKKRRAAE